MKITINANGPIIVETGGHCVVEVDGVEESIERAKVALCRCGQSQRKPFCDGSHKTCGFEAPSVSMTMGTIQ